MTHRRWAACLLAGLVLWTAAIPAEARRDSRHDRRDEIRQRGEPARREGISLDEAVSRVRRDSGGRVLSAEARGDTYRIKVLLPNGAVRVVNVDARSGHF